MGSVAAYHTQMAPVVYDERRMPLALDNALPDPEV
jgi:hypothetical protein